MPSPADLPNSGIEPGSPALQADSLPTELSGKPQNPKNRYCYHPLTNDQAETQRTQRGASGDSCKE